MKKRAMRIVAVILAAFMMLSMCGCEDMLYLLADYAMDSSEFDMNSLYENYETGDTQNSGLDSFYQDYGYDFGDYDYVTIDDLYSDYDDSYPNFSDSSDDGDIIVVSQVPDSNVLDTTLREPLTTIYGDGRDEVTIMIYMCASNLESDSGLAFMDIKEMMSATSSGNVNIVIETGGCKDWSTNQISGSTNQRHIIENGRLTTVEKRLGQRDMTDGETLTDFIRFCTEEYPANRNMLILWDHGAGAVDGWGYDEYNYYDTLTIDELGEALYNAGTTFDFIGFDACLMSTMEIACVLYDFADYMIASEDYESGYGWEYKYWLTDLAKDPSTPTLDLAKTICDDFVTESGSSDAILAAIDLAYMKLVYSTWRSFAFAAQEQLLDSNFTWTIENEGVRSLDDILGLLSTEADIADMMAIANSVDGVPETEALISALASAIAYCSANRGCADMTGLAVTLPYGDSAGYRSIEKIFSAVGFDDEYIDLLGEFTRVDNAAGSYDWSDWYSTYDDYGTWSDYYSDNGDSYTDYDWDSWGGWEDFFAGYLGGTAGSYFSDFFSDYYGYYDDYNAEGSDEYSSYDEYYNDNYGDQSMEEYYNNYYNNYSDHGFGYSDYDLSDYNDYYDYYDYYYNDYYNDYYYGDSYSDWDNWFSEWFGW